MVRWFSLVFALLFGCATIAQPGDQPTEQPVETPTEKYRRINLELAQALKAANGDCGQIATTLSAWVAAHGAEMKPLLDHLAAWEVATPDAAVKAYHDALFDAVSMRVMAAQRCSDPRSRAAFESYYRAAGQWAEPRQPGPSGR